MVRPASEDYDRDAVYSYQYSIDDKYSGIYHWMGSFFVICVKIDI